MSLLSRILYKFLKDKTLTVLQSHPKTTVGAKFKIGNFCQVSLDPNLKSVSIGKAVNLRNSINFVVGKSAELGIEDGVFMNNNCSINCLEKINIGAQTLFGENVKLYDHNHQFQTNPEFRVSHQAFNTAPIVIGKNCWLGSNVTILKGVTIGDNCIIGAHVLVYQNVPSNSILKLKQETIVEGYK